MVSGYRKGKEKKELHFQSCLELQGTEVSWDDRIQNDVVECEHGLSHQLGANWMCMTGAWNIWNWVGFEVESKGF